MNTDVLIDGYKPAELIHLDELEELTLGKGPIVFSVGAARVMAQFTMKKSVLFTTLAVVEAGGEGVLPLLIKAIETAARNKECIAIEWTVLSRNCSAPNPKLNRVLERLGFEVLRLDTGSEHYWQRKSINDSLLSRKR